MHQLRTKGIKLLQSRNITQQISETKPQTRYVVSPPLGKVHKMTTLKSSSTISMKTWPVAMIESRGDYREEAFLDELIGGPLYSAQKSLPRLPIPSIEETISTFLPTALPLAQSEEEVNNLMAASEVFPQQAEQLHQRLIARKDDEMDNSSWLQLWWNTEGYLKSEKIHCFINCYIRCRGNMLI